MNWELKPIKELRSACKQRGLDTSSCIVKEDLIHLLEQTSERANAEVSSPFNVGKYADDTLSMTDLKAMSLPQLRRIAKQRSVDLSGAFDKEGIIGRLQASFLKDLDGPQQVADTGTSPVRRRRAAAEVRSPSPSETEAFARDGVSSGGSQPSRAPVPKFAKQQETKTPAASSRVDSFAESGLPAAGLQQSRPRGPKSEPLKQQDIEQPATVVATSAPPAGGSADTPWSSSAASSALLEAVTAGAADAVFRELMEITRRGGPQASLKAVRHQDDNMRYSLLHWLCCEPASENSAAIASHLLMAQADVNQRNSEGDTPLHLAIEASIEVSDENASFSRHVIELLIGGGADPSLRCGTSGMLPIESAEFAPAIYDVLRRHVDLDKSQAAGKQSFESWLQEGSLAQLPVQPPQQLSTSTASEEPRRDATIPSLTELLANLDAEIDDDLEKAAAHQSPHLLESSKDSEKNTLSSLNHLPQPSKNPGQREEPTADFHRKGEEDEDDIPPFDDLLAALDEQVQKDSANADIRVQFDEDMRKVSEEAEMHAALDEELDKDFEKAAIHSHTDLVEPHQDTALKGHLNADCFGQEQNDSEAGANEPRSTGDPALSDEIASCNDIPADSDGEEAPTKLQSVHEPVSVHNLPSYDEILADVNAEEQKHATDQELSSEGPPLSEALAQQESRADLNCEEQNDSEQTDIPSYKDLLAKLDAEVRTDSAQADAVAQTQASLQQSEHIRLQNEDNMDDVEKSISEFLQKSEQHEQRQRVDASTHLQQMDVSMRDLREKCKAQGVDLTECFDKAAVLARLQKHVQEPAHNSRSLFKPEAECEPAQDADVHICCKTVRELQEECEQRGVDLVNCFDKADLIGRWQASFQSGMTQASRQDSVRSTPSLKHVSSQDAVQAEKSEDSRTVQSTPSSERVSRQDAAQADLSEDSQTFQSKKIQHGSEQSFETSKASEIPDWHSMSMKALRKELKLRGIDVSQCCDKADFIKKLIAHDELSKAEGNNMQHDVENSQDALLLDDTVHAEATISDPIHSACEESVSSKELPFIACNSDVEHYDMSANDPEESLQADNQSTTADASSAPSNTEGDTNESNDDSQQADDFETMPASQLIDLCKSRGINLLGLADRDDVVELLRENMGLVCGVQEEEVSEEAPAPAPKEAPAPEVGEREEELPGDLEAPAPVPAPAPAPVEACQFFSMSASDHKSFPCYDFVETSCDGLTLRNHPDLKESEGAMTLQNSSTIRECLQKMSFEELIAECESHGVCDFFFCYDQSAIIERLIETLQDGTCDAASDGCLMQPDAWWDADEAEVSKVISAASSRQPDATASASSTSRVDSDSKTGMSLGSMDTSVFKAPIESRDFSAMSMRELRSACAKLQVDVAGCYDKGHMLYLLRRDRQARAEALHDEQDAAEAAAKAKAAQEERIAVMRKAEERQAAEAAARLAAEMKAREEKEAAEAAARAAEERRIAEEKAEEERQVAEAAAKAAEEERIASERKAEEERLAAERLAAEMKAREEKEAAAAAAAAARAAEERRIAEEKAEEERQAAEAAEQQAKERRLAAEAAVKVAAEKKAEEERLAAAAAARAAEERRIAEMKAEEEIQAAEAAARALEEEKRIASERKAEEERLNAEAAKKAQEERLAAEAAAWALEEERIGAARKAEEERLAAQAAARALKEKRIAAKKAEKERWAAEAIAKAKEEKRTAAARKGEQERLAAEAAVRAAQEATATEKCTTAGEEAQKFEKKRAVRQVEGERHTSFANACGTVGLDVDSSSPALGRDVESMSTRELKRECTSRGLDVRRCSDRAGLIEVLSASMLPKPEKETAASNSWTSTPHAAAAPTPTTIPRLSLSELFKMDWEELYQKCLEQGKPAFKTDLKGELIARLRQQTGRVSKVQSPTKTPAPLVVPTAASDQAVDPPAVQAPAKARAPDEQVSKVQPLRAAAQEVETPEIAPPAAPTTAAGQAAEPPTAQAPSAKARTPREQAPVGSRDTTPPAKSRTPREQAPVGSRDTTPSAKARTPREQVPVGSRDTTPPAKARTLSEQVSKAPAPAAALPKVELSAAPPPVMRSEVASPAADLPAAQAPPAKVPVVPADSQSGNGANHSSQAAAAPSAKAPSNDSTGVAAAASSAKASGNAATGIPSTSTNAVNAEATSTSTASTPSTAAKAVSKAANAAEDLNKCSVKELVAMAKERCVDVASCVEKAEIVERLRNPAKYRIKATASAKKVHGVSAKRAQSKGFAKSSSAASKPPPKAAVAKSPSAAAAPAKSSSANTKKPAAAAKASAPAPACKGKVNIESSPQAEDDLSPSSGFGWSARVARYFETHPGFSAMLPPEAETWSDQDLQVYFGSNGEIWPKGKRPSWYQSKKSTPDPGNQPSKPKTYPELKEHFEKLDLAETTPHDMIRRHYKRMARDCHPDKNPDDPDAKQRFQELTQAFDAIRERLKL